MTSDDPSTCVCRRLHLSFPTLFQLSMFVKLFSVLTFVFLLSFFFAYLSHAQEKQTIFFVWKSFSLLSFSFAGLVFITWQSGDFFSRHHLPIFSHLSSPLFTHLIHPPQLISVSPTDTEDYSHFLSFPLMVLCVCVCLFDTISTRLSADFKWSSTIPASDFLGFFILFCKPICEQTYFGIFVQKPC